MSSGRVSSSYGDFTTRMGVPRKFDWVTCRTPEKRVEHIQFVPNMHAGYTLEEIRQKARETWLKPDVSETSYQYHFREKHSAVDEPTRMRVRPTSPTRMNNPHPSAVFMTTRMQSVPGYNTDAIVLGKVPDHQMSSSGPYKVDASVSPRERKARDAIKAKYIGQPHSAAINQYKMDDEQEYLNRQAANTSLTSGRNYCEFSKDNELAKVHSPNTSREYQHRTIPSLHRYLREAGAEEAAKLQPNSYYQRLLSDGRAQSAGPNRYKDHVMEQKLQESSEKKQARFAHKSASGEFLMRPEWKPDILHHRLNGLSPINTPYHGRK